MKYIEFICRFEHIMAQYLKVRYILDTHLQYSMFPGDVSDFTKQYIPLVTYSTTISLCYLTISSPQNV